MGVDEAEVFAGRYKSVSVADIMYFMIQRSSLINILQLGKILIL